MLTNRIPVIGVTGFHDNALVHWGGPYRAVMCETSYTDALRSQGALPIVLTADVLHVGAIIDLVDALLLTGGPDISPSLYGQAREPHTRPADHVRDDFEIALVRAAFAAGTPILGICRGMQMLNVALGGSLIQHIDGHLRVETPAESAQPTAIIPGTRLHALLGVEQLNVNSLHHQAIGTLAPGLAISASAADDVVEAVEAVEHEGASVLGVQWHPEKLKDSFTQKALISWLLHHSAAPAAASRPRSSGDLMPLHPVAAQLIADSKASGRPNAHLLPVSTARENFERDFAGLERPDVAIIKDFDIPTSDGTADIPARLYRSDGGSEVVPLIVYFHGGGWLLGSVDSHDGITRRLALATGMAVLSIGYRRGPEARFPNAVDDAVTAVRWATANASDLGADPARLAIAGDSAGGNLATVAAALLSDDVCVTVRHQLLIYPSTTCNLEQGFDPEYEGIMLYRDELQWHQDNYLSDPEDATDPRVSPLLADLRGLPPATVIVAECDPIRPQGSLYADALRRAGVPVAIREYQGMLHGFFGLDMLWDEARHAMDFAAAELAAALKPTLG